MKNTEIIKEANIGQNVEISNIEAMLIVSTWQAICISLATSDNNKDAKEYKPGELNLEQSFTDYLKNTKVTPTKKILRLSHDDMQNLIKFDNFIKRMFPSIISLEDTAHKLFSSLFLETEDAPDSADPPIDEPTVTVRRNTDVNALNYEKLC